jgi:hypothetical protein
MSTFYTSQSHKQSTRWNAWFGMQTYGDGVAEKKVARGSALKCRSRWDGMEPIGRDFHLPSQTYKQTASVWMQVPASLFFLNFVVVSRKETVSTESGTMCLRHVSWRKTNH